MINRKILALALVPLAFILSACTPLSEQSDADVSRSLTSVQVPFPDGMSVDCTIFDNDSYGSSISCQWSLLHKTTEGGFPKRNGVKGIKREVSPGRDAYCVLFDGRNYGTDITCQPLTRN